MANSKHPIVRSLFIVLFCASALLQDATGSRVVHNFPTGYRISSPETEIKLKDKTTKGSLIGSVAPTCTYNECRGCKYKCRAEQVPVEGNDPINSAYHYKCVCHR
ncbi:hypothetical protein CASFOL_029213 [Castilleja foliolosa]|uniref:Stomagen C-terminal domain-containing protein n=1 Tax=Castilleja foliolosa TaxID=1961234 RepID=A0ABD3CAY4_9LAMI